MKDFKGEEKRKYLRLNKNLVISYIKEDKDKGYDLSQIHNISQGGLLFNASQEFEEGDVLSIWVRFPFLKERTNILAEVVGCQKLRKRLYQVRVQFVEIPEDVLGKFKDYMKNMQLKKDDPKTKEEE